MQLLDFLDTLADAAAAAIMPHFRTPLLNIDNKHKQGFDPVTEADRAGEKAMRHLIQEHFENHGILGEEFGSHNPDAERVWILDPIDGTRAFISGLPTWGILIGHKSQGHADIGMMCQPFTEERFSGDGKTAWYQHKSGEKTKLKTRPCLSLSEATLLTTAPDLFTQEQIGLYQAIEKQARLVRYGTDCYAYCMVASGQADLVIEANLNAYDIAALIPIVEGAGGIVTTWNGSNPINGGSIVASGDPALHDLVLKQLQF